MVVYRDPKRKTVEEVLIAVVILIAVISIIGCIICCFQFRRDKRKKKAARDMIVENARIGQKLTQEQAEALFELNESYEKFFAACANTTKNSRKLLRKNAVLCVDYFRLQRWAKRLREAEEGEDEKELHRVVRKVASELDGHSDMFPVKPETKRQLHEIAQLPDRTVTFVSASPV